MRLALFLVVSQRQDLSSDVQQRLKLTEVPKIRDCLASCFWRSLIHALALDGLYTDGHKFSTYHQSCSPVTLRCARTYEYGGRTCPPSHVSVSVRKENFMLKRLVAEAGTRG